MPKLCFIHFIHNNVTLILNLTNPNVWFNEAQNAFLIFQTADPGSIPGLGRFCGEDNGSPLQYSCLGNPMDIGAWWAIQSMGLQRVGHN